ncbi:MAG: adenosylmethionine decarboxylase [Candidatus Dormibacteria bacterium]
MLEGLFGAIVGSAIVAFTAYLGFKLTRRTVKHGSHDQAAELMLRLDHVFVEHPQLRGLISEEATLASDDPVLEHARFRAATELIADTLEGILDRLALGEYDADDAKSWRDYVHETYTRSPQVRDLVARKPDWYPTLVAQEKVPTGDDKAKARGTPEGKKELLGTHLVGDLWSPKILSTEDARHLLQDVAVAVRVNIKELVVVPFANAGLTAIAVLAESHMSLHTWPERGYVAFDLFTCGPSVDSSAVASVFESAFGAARLHLRELRRGPDVAPPFSERTPDVPGEHLYPGATTLERLDSVHQSIAVLEVPGLGRVLALDDVIQVAELDAYVYHELIVHPALCAHPNPQAVTIVGGGDGHALLEVLKHPEVRSVRLLEHDDKVIGVAKASFKGVSAGFADRRVHVEIGDAMDLLKATTSPADVIICDMTDPVGQAARFFSGAFYRLAESRLGSDGILVAQIGSLHWHGDLIKECLLEARRVFPHVSLLAGAMASYHGAWWTFLVAGRSGDPRRAARQVELPTRLYRTEEHSWYFMPESIVLSLLGPLE